MASSNSRRYYPASAYFIRAGRRTVAVLLLLVCGRVNFITLSRVLKFQSKYLSTPFVHSLPRPPRLDLFRTAPKFRGQSTWN